MKIKDLPTKIALCIVPVALCILAHLITQDLVDSKSDFLISGISTFNATIIVMYIFGGRDKMKNGDEKMKYLGKKIDSLFVINQICLAIILILFYTKFLGVIVLTESYMFILLILYGNYYSLKPMPTGSISVFFEDEDVWKKYCKLRGRLLFVFGIVGLILVIYFAPKGLGKYTITILYGIMAITFIITYFYAKNQYFKKFNR
jgi:hypothetical protein